MGFREEGVAGNEGSLVSEVAEDDGDSILVLRVRASNGGGGGSVALLLSIKDVFGYGIRCIDIPPTSFFNPKVKAWIWRPKPNFVLK